LKIVVGGEISSGNSSTAVCPDDTDAKAFEKESESFGWKDFTSVYFYKTIFSRDSPPTTIFNSP